MFDLAQKLLSLSEELLRLAEQKDWQAFTQIQTQRAQIVSQLNQLDTSALTKADADALRQTLSMCRTLERQSTVLATTYRNSLTAEQTKVSKGKAMQKAYGAYGRRR